MLPGEADDMDLGGPNNLIRQKAASSVLHFDSETLRVRWEFAFCNLGSS